ncbi:MAG: hypothetical protein WC554_10080, partial [Clostridia bacterium]
SIKKEAVTKYRLEKGDLLQEEKDVVFSLVMHSITEFARTSDTGFTEQGNINKIEDRMIINEQTEEIGNISLEDNTLDGSLLENMFSVFIQRSAEEVVQTISKIAPDVLKNLNALKFSKYQEKLKSATEPFDVGKAEIKIKEIEKQLKQLSKDSYEKQKRIEESLKLLENDLTNIFSAFKFDQSPQLSNPTLLSELNSYLTANGKGTFMQYTSNELEKDIDVDNLIKNYLLEKLNNYKLESKNATNLLEESSNQEKEKLEHEKNILSEKLYHPETLKQLDESENEEIIEPEFYVDSGVVLDASGVFIGQCYIYEGSGGIKGKLIKDLQFDLNQLSRDSYTIDNVINEYGKAYILDEVKKSLIRYSNSVIPIINPDTIGTYITFPIDTKIDNIDQLDTTITKKGRIRFIQQGLIDMDKLGKSVEQTEKSLENE